ncbi:MAG: T9SS type A sorting domain-containing protein, partial [Bacteroidia bacterium]|nr:T9SS type A sorting domain-containing protein [Bacteroidia bacterium]
YAGTPGSVTLLGFTAAELNVLDNISNAGNLIATSNASWAVLGGASGPAPANKVLIAQFTTNGTFSFKLNLQLGTPTPGVSQNYVAENPTGSEILFPGLIYPAPSNPTALVSIASNVSFPVCQGTSVTFTATPTNGGATPSYQWKKNGVNVGSNSPTYTSSTLANNNEIKCIMTSSIPGALNNPATSNAIIAGILSAPSVPQVTATGPTTYCSGTNLCTLSTPTTPGLSYQWIKGSNPIAGATNAVYVPTSTSSSNYKVIVTNSLGCSKTSSATAITVNKNPTATVTSSGPTTFCSGANACTLTANAGAGLSYQWFKGSNPLANATGISYVPTSSSNSYKVRVTNANGCTKTSSSTAIVVNPLPTATITPQGPTTFCAGDSVILQASSGAGLTYQWLQGTSVISGATASSYTAKLARTYKVTVTNANGCSKTSKGLKTTINCREGELAGAEQIAQLELYPNPNDGNFMVHYSGSNENSTSITLHIVDMTGRMVHSETIETMDGTLSARVSPGSSLAAGIYFVRLLDGENEVVGKFIVE